MADAGDVGLSVDLFGLSATEVRPVLREDRGARPRHGATRRRSRVAGVPEVFAEPTSERVPVMAQVAGHPVDGAAAVAATGVPAKDLADRTGADYMGLIGFGVLAACAAMPMRPAARPLHRRGWRERNG